MKKGMKRTMIREKDRQTLLRVVDNLTFPEKIGYDDYETEAIRYTEDLRSLDFISSLSSARNGMSKLVINIIGIPYVIKTAFDGEWLNCIDEDGNEFEDFYYYCGYEDSNYCKDELNIIHNFNRNGFSALTPKTFLLCVKDGREFYAQEKGFVFRDSKCLLKPSEKSLKKARENFGHNVLSVEWIAKVIDLYGLEYFNTFFTWCQTYAYDTYKDLHGGNYGMRADGTPMIMDFGGFNE